MHFILNYVKISAFYLNDLINFAAILSTGTGSVQKWIVMNNYEYFIENMIF